MRDQSRTVLALVAILAVFGLMKLPPAGSKAEDQAQKLAGEAPGGAESETPPASDTSYLDPLRSFFHLRRANNLSIPWFMKPFAKQLQDSTADQVFATADQVGYDLEFLIVTVPDPVASPFASWFDLTLDAVQRAVEKEVRGVIDRRWLPWPRDKKAAPSAGTELVAEQQPGTMLFRIPPKDSENPSLLVVFLVGETPTSGIHSRAFEESVRFIKKMTWLKTKQPTTIRVLGPVFSGSETSLKRALIACGNPDLCLGGPPTFNIISGSASAFHKAEFEEEVEEAVCAEVTFRATVIPTALVLEKLIEHIRTKDPDAKIALLTEASTGFGRKTIEAIKRRKVGRKTIEAIKPDQPDQPERLPQNVIQLSFPLYISRVRAAVEKKEREKLASQQPPQTGRLLTHFPLDEDNPAGEWVPAMAPGVTTATVEQILSQLLETISQEEYRYVGIVATDERDKLFLAKRVRAFCPDVQLFTTSASLIFWHPDFIQDTRGMLVGSTYPLWSRNQLWSFPARGGEERRPFANQQAEGVYNAAVALLGGNALLDYGFPGEGVDKGHVSRPPLWISAVGRNGLLPVDVKRLSGAEAPGVGNYKDYVYPGKAGDGTSDRTTAPVSWLWFSVILAMTLLCGAICYKGWDYSRGQRDPGAAPPAGPPVPAAPPPPGPAVAAAAPVPRGQLARLDDSIERSWPFPREATEAGVYLSLCLGLVALFGWYVSGRFWPPSGSHLLYHAVSLVTLLVAVALAAGVVANWGFLAGKRLARPGGRVRPNVVGAAVALTLAIAAAGILIWLRNEAFGDTERRAQHYFERWVLLANGLSPLLPAFFLTLVLCCCLLCSLKRLELIQSFGMDNPLWPDGGASPRLKRVQDAYMQIKTLLMYPLYLGRADAWKGLVLLILLVAALARLGNCSVPSFEQSRSFDFLLRLGFAIAAFLTLSVMLRLHLLWARIKDLLHKLAVLPIVSAYSRLPGKISALFGRYVNPQRPHRSHLVLPLHQWGLIVGEYDRVKGRLKEVLEAAPTTPAPTTTATAPAGAASPLDAFDAVVAEYRSTRFEDGDDDLVCATDTAHAHLEKACRASVKVLERLWDRVPIEAAYGFDAEKGAEAKPEEKAGEYVLHFPPPQISDPPPDEDVKRWLRMLEDFVAMQSVRFLCQFFAPLRNLINCLLIAPLLLLLLVTSYPFQPQHLLLVFLMTILGAVAVQLVTMLVQMDRDEVLSRISRTTPNRVTFDLPFLTSLLTYTVPVLAIVMGVFGEVGGLVGSWFEPIARTLK